MSCKRVVARMVFVVDRGSRGLEWEGMIIHKDRLIRSHRLSM